MGCPNPVPSTELSSQMKRRTQPVQTNNVVKVYRPKNNNLYLDFTISGSWKGVNLFLENLVLMQRSVQLSIKVGLVLQKPINQSITPLLFQSTVIHWRNLFNHDLIPKVLWIMTSSCVLVMLCIATDSWVPLSHTLIYHHDMLFTHNLLNRIVFRV